MFDVANNIFAERNNNINYLTVNNGSCRPVLINSYKNNFSDENIICYDIIYSSDSIAKIEYCNLKLNQSYLYNKNNDNYNVCFYFLRKLKNDSVLITYKKENINDFVKILNNTSESSDSSYFIYTGTIKNFDGHVINIKILSCKNYIQHIHPEQYYSVFGFESNNDVSLSLAKGLSIFRQNFLNEFKINIFENNTINGCLKKYLYNNKCFDDVFEFTDNIQHFISCCVVGPRCQTLHNEQHECKNINALDANSLYTSAINNIGGFLKGLPVELQQNELNYNFINTKTYYYIEINVIRVNKNLDYPLYRNDNNEYTNDFSGKNLYVDKITLEDYILYHDIEFEIIRGYYFNNGFNNNIIEINNYLYSKRLENKKNKSIELVYKLMLNSIYGLTLIKKKIKKTIHITGKEMLDNYINKNCDFVLSYEEFSDNDDKPNEYKKYKIVELQKINNHNNNYNLCHIGCYILSGSKQIMNKVFDLANTNNIKVYYTDTDSAFIDNNDIELLKNKYYEKYNKVMFGKELGQFKKEFDNGFSAVFLNKKKYVLQNDKKDLDNDKNCKIRCAGIHIDDLITYSVENNISLLQMYSARLGNDYKFIIPVDAKKLINCSNFSTKENNIYTYSF